MLKYDVNWHGSTIELKKRKISELDEPDDLDETNEIEDNETHEMTKNSMTNFSRSIRSEGNNIYFYADINKKSIINLQKITQKVVNLLTEKAHDMERLGFEVKYPPIKLHINSPGGYVYCTFSFIDFMTQIKLNNPNIKFHTIIEGGSASGATLMSVTGDRRFITKYGYMLIHELSSSCWGKYTSMKDDMKNNEALMKRICDIYAQHSNLTKKELNKLLKHDIFWDAEKCLQVGLVDEIIQ